jgi:hypothetical protein
MLSARAVENRFAPGPGGRMRLRFSLCSSSLCCCWGPVSPWPRVVGTKAREAVLRDRALRGPRTRAPSRNLRSATWRQLAARDYREACATRAMRDRSSLVRSAGTCERAFRVILASQESDLLRDARIGNVKVRGSRASVSWTLPGGQVDNDPLLAIKEGDRWGLISEETLNEDRSEGRDARRRLRAKYPACPPGTDLVRVSALVVGLPPAYELARVAEEPAVVDFLRVALRGRLRLVETKVLLRRGRKIGTSVTVLNSRERPSAQGPWLTRSRVRELQERPEPQRSRSLASNGASFRYPAAPSRPPRSAPVLR